ncbi:hypothetical protein AAFC00_000850 [Neodothiora populina]|uniref:Carboxylic ester hydrolase n=1 Tax=Neodothiora populina TaxID=2781224 RepID=A0ABR3PM82_9PEZI
MPSNYSTSLFPFQAGPLGYIDGLTVSDSAAPYKALCHYFGGIPYALPPTGPYRFRRPRPLPSQFKYGTKANPSRFTGGTAVCPQPGNLGPPDKSLWDEDCLQVNIWIPAGKPPAGGWPIFFYIHGGFLQWGNPNLQSTAYAPLLSETEFKCMIVMPAYRLNVFGFVASKELADEASKNGESSGNMGFWDQRTALEWTANHISCFGGNPKNITVGGYSAGSYSTFQQLAHDIFLPKESSIIKRAIMWSNGSGVQPKFMSEHQQQFDELLEALQIPLTLSPSDKLASLRSVPADKIASVQDSLAKSEFRALSDGAFIDKELFTKINNGTFARRIKDRGVKILNGECRDEHFSYGEWRKPQNSYQAVYYRLVADYPEACVENLMSVYCPDRRLPAWAKNWQDFFGKVYADTQVHTMERGFANKLAQGGLTVGVDLLRYRIDWRAKCTDAMLPPAWKVTHASDLPIWFWGMGLGAGLTDAEKGVVEEINSFFSRFVKGDDVQWTQKGPQWMHRLTARGTMDMWLDERWEDGLTVWSALNEDGAKSGLASRL